MVDAASQLGIHRLELDMEPLGNEARHLVWDSDAPLGDAAPTVRMSLPVPQHTAGEPAQITVTIATGEVGLRK